MTERYIIQDCKLQSGKYNLCFTDIPKAGSYYFRLIYFTLDVATFLTEKFARNWTIWRFDQKNNWGYYSSKSSLQIIVYNMGQDFMKSQYNLIIV